MDNIQTELIIIITLISLLVVGVFLVISNKKSSKKSDKPMLIDEQFINKLISLLGDLDNIKDVEVINKRLKIDVKNIKLVNVKELHEIATRGVFVTNNSLKMVFSYESLAIKKQLDKIIKK